MHLLYQSVGQIIRQWGSDGLDAWYEAASWRGYAAITDIDMAGDLSATIGQYGVLGWTEGDNTGSHSKPFEAGSRSRGSTVAYQEIARPLMRPEEIMHDLREDAMIVVPKQGRPLICGRAIYFRRPEFTSRSPASLSSRDACLRKTPPLLPVRGATSTPFVLKSQEVRADAYSIAASISAVTSVTPPSLR